MPIHGPSGGDLGSYRSALNYYMRYTSLDRQSYYKTKVSTSAVPYGPPVPEPKGTGGAIRAHSPESPRSAQFSQPESVCNFSGGGSSGAETIKNPTYTPYLRNGL